MRWSWRDLRAHWVAVMTIASVMAIGVGVYAGLGSTSAWRRQSNDASFASLSMHDLRVALTPGTFADEGMLVGGLAKIGLTDSVVAAEERLIVDSQVDASSETDTILVAARLVGMDLASADVDRLWVRDGVVPAAVAGAAPVGVLEAKFADFWGLDPSGTVAIGQGTAVSYAGLGAIPEDFFYGGPEGTILSQGELAPLYLPLADVQTVTGRSGQVNDVVVTVTDDADLDRVASQLRSMVDELGVSASVTTRDDEPAFRVLYEDIENDQRFWNALAGLILIAAALAAFNLINRIVESQRREIGIGMALGVSRRTLAIRPLLVGVQVAVVGAIGGVGIGFLMGEAMADLLRSFLPLPDYRTPFQFGVFMRGAALGLVVPVVAAAIPVWRAVRVEPIEAIRTGHLAAKSSRLTDWTSRIRLPGSTLTQMPIRNTLRNPRRTALTAVGVGAAITALVAVFAMLDSFGRTIDQVGKELTKGDSEQVIVQLDTFHRVDSAVVDTIRDMDSVGAVDLGVRVPATAVSPSGADDLELLVEFVDLDGARWTPTLSSSAPTADPGILLAAKAARDLGVGVGDVLVVRHPARRANDTFALVESSLGVAGIHVNPLRGFAYMDASSAGAWGLDGDANIAHAYPAPGSNRADVQHDLFGAHGVASTQATARIADSFDEALDQFVGFLVIASVAVLLLAVLIAFNAARITVDERRREHATMRAFGVPVRSIIAVVVKESVLVGVAATLIGIGAGIVFLDWMLGSLATTSLPDLSIARHVSPRTIVLATVVGTVAVAIAPLFLAARIRRMDIPDTLRVME